ncbi:hypothetical protein GY45DRAFT_1375976 [Cubamyces sp. BRFM 1775]|nr:hypothetical protein GY45DRAFT_1375976 [Cubamyces sp. BRFM 1775]
MDNSRLAFGVTITGESSSANVHGLFIDGVRHALGRCGRHKPALGKCESLGANLAPFDGTYQSWMTGGAGAGTITPSATQGIAWPPAQLTDIPAVSMESLPQYTATATAATLPPPSFRRSPTVSVDNGWSDASDNAQATTAIARCTYPGARDAEGAQITVSGCLPAAR